MWSQQNTISFCQQCGWGNLVFSIQNLKFNFILRIVGGGIYQVIFSSTDFIHLEI